MYDLCHVFCLSSENNMTAAKWQFQSKNALREQETLHSRTKPINMRTILINFKCKHKFENWRMISDMKTKNLHVTS